MELQLIGTGNTAQVYEWGDTKVLKLFYEGYPVSAIDREFENAMAVKELNFAKTRVYEIIQYKGRVGIIYDKASGETLVDWVFRTGDLDKCAHYMSLLHKQILEIEQQDLPNYKDFLEYHIRNSANIDKNKREKALQILKELPEGNTLCHGDFYPGNILISGTDTCVIDFMNLCKGNYLYDIARTVYLVGYTPVAEDDPNKDFLIHAKKTLTDMYLSYMGVTKAMIEDYLTVIKAARSGECPNE